MITKPFLAFLFLALIVFSACSQKSSPVFRADYCGYELSAEAFGLLKQKSAGQPDPYAADKKWDLYMQINDSIRSNVSDSLEFELFLTFVSPDEISIDLYCINDPAFIQQVSCVLMNGRYAGKMPKQRYLNVYAYSEPDGSGDSPFVIALSRKP